MRFSPLSDWWFLPHQSNFPFPDLAYDDDRYAVFCDGDRLACPFHLRHQRCQG